MKTSTYLVNHYYIDCDSAYEIIAPTYFKYRYLYYLVGLLEIFGEEVSDSLVYNCVLQILDPNFTGFAITEEELGSP